MAKSYVRYERFHGGYTPIVSPYEAALLRADSVRARRGSYVKRPGTSTFGNVPDTGKITSLLQAGFATGSSILRCRPADIRTYVSTTETWDVVHPSDRTFSGEDADIWRGAMIFDDWFMSQGERFFDAAGTTLLNEGILKMASAGTVMTPVTDSPGVRDLIAFAGRLVGLHPHYSDGNKYSYRLVYTDAGNAEDWYTKGGYYDITDNDAPLQRGIVLAGRLFLLRGNQYGGAVVMGVATGSALLPFAFETVHGVGLLGPSALVRIGPSTAMFIGHDAIYVLSPGGIDRVQGSQYLSEVVLGNVDMDLLNDVYMGYRPQTSEVYLVIPTSASHSERYVYNLNTRTWVGPENAVSYTDMEYAQISVSDSWDSTPGTDTWDAGDSSTWDDSVGKTVGRPVFLLARADGAVYAEEDNTTSDQGPTAISSVVELGDVTFEGVFFRLIGRGAPVRADAAEVVAVDAVILRYNDQGNFPLKLEISRNGGDTWTTVYDGPVAGNGSGTVKERRFTFNALTGTSFRVRLTSSDTTSRWQYVGVDLEARYVGPRLD